MVSITRALDLPADFHILVQQSEQENFAFVRRLEEEWKCGKNRFDRTGEFLLIASERGKTVGSGGINIDPYIASSTGEFNVARLRHLYVLPARRSANTGTRIVKACLDQLSDQFDTIRLRVPNMKAGRFYEKLGFKPTQDATASHLLRIR